MSLRLWSVLIVMGVVAGRSSAQFPPPMPRQGLAPPGIRVGPPSHVPGQGEEQIDDIRQWLSGVFPKNPADMDPKVLKDLVDKVGKMPKGEQPNQQQVEQLLKNNPQFKDPAFLKQLKTLVDSPDFPKNLQQKLPREGPRPPLPDNPEELADKFKKVIEGANQPAGGDPGPNPGPDGLKPPDPDGETPKPNIGDNEWVKFLEKTFGDSPAAQAAISDLAESLGGSTGKGLFDQVPEFGGDLWKDFEGLKGPGGDGFKLKPPDLDTAGWGGPKVGEGGGGTFGGGGGGPSFGGGGGGAAGGGTALAVIAGIAAAVFLAILFLRKWQLRREAALAGAGPAHGPLDFSGVRTREQLVQAFDTVSLDQCGAEARAWNHRVIADQMGDARPAIAAPAADLGRMYEVARYAPPDEDLRPAEYVEARKDLSVIAGGPA